MSSFEQYSTYLQDAMESWNCPGAAVIVVRGDEVLHQAAYGLRDVEGQQPMTLDTRFAMASVTKSFTAMSIALLVDDGKLEWDKPVREYMPEFILHDPYITANITVRDMLSHRTGLPRHDFVAWRMELSLDEFIKRMRHLKFSATFREKFQYNNLMYYAAGYLIEKLSGMKWADFMHQRIFQPLGMAASNFSPEAPQPDQITAFGYRVDRDEDGGAKGLIRMPYGHHSSLTPGTAGALFSTAADLLQWLRVHVNEGQAGDVRLVSAANLKQMHLPHTIIPSGGIHEALFGSVINTYGMGWAVTPYRGYTLVEHGGNVEGFSLSMGCIPEEKIGVIGLTNVAGLPLRDAILFESIDRALGLPERDWNKKFHALMDPVLAAEAHGKQTSASERVDDAPPTHPLETYVGVYSADGYPDFAVRKLDDSSLQASTVGSLDWSTLRPYHYNVFEWHLTDFDFYMKIRFQVNDNGEIDSIAVPIEPAVDHVIFKRKPLELSADALAAITGKYVTEIPGLAFIITIRDGKVYINAEGDVAAEAKPYRQEEAMIGVESQGVRFEFIRENGTFDKFLYKAPGTTLEAKRA